MPGNQHNYRPQGGTSTPRLRRWADSTIPLNRSLFSDVSPSPQENSNLHYPGSLQREIRSEEEPIWANGSGFTCWSGTQRQDRKVWKLEVKGAAEDYNSHHAPAQRRLRTERRLPMRP